jgi:hypothetical protein
VRDQASGQDDNHLCPMFPSWAWVAWKGASRIQLMQYFFWGSEMKILDIASFSRIPSSANLRHRFRTTQANDHGGLGFLEGILPIITKMGHFQMVTSEDAPGHVDILTMDEEYAGSCDVRGVLDTENLKKCEANLIQIWVEHNKGKGSNSNVMLVELHDFPGNDRHQQRDLVKALAEQSLAVTKLSDATAQHMNEDDKFRKKMEGDCPNSLIVRYPPEGLQPSNTFLASRLGVGYVNFDKWVKCDPKDALLFLG